jgi:4a-hydroxytetrahydrobiopterin dehydratase
MAAPTTSLDGTDDPGAAMLLSMPRPPALTPDQVADALKTLPGWTGDATGIHREIECSSFPAAIAVVDAIAVAAEAADHHPDIDIRWRTLRFGLSTHDVGGVTELDIALAHEIDAEAANG